MIHQYNVEVEEPVANLARNDAEFYKVLLTINSRNVPEENALEIMVIKSKGGFHKEAYII